MKAAWLVLGVCISCGGSGPGDDDGSELPPASLGTAATYAMTTTVDVTAAAVLPEPAFDLLVILHELRDDPGSAFFDLLDAAGVPLVDELRAALPDVVEDKVAGWITSATSPRLKTELDALLAAADAALARFDLLSELELPPADARGHARATHRLTGVRFGSVALPLPPIDTVTSVPVDATLARGALGADAALKLGPHGYGLAYGERIYELLETLARQKNPGGLRALLGEAVDCHAVAATVAGKCVLGVCVGHASQLEALCERGLDEAVARLEDKLVSLRIEAILLDAGAADMWDDGGDDTVDRLAGAWQARVNFSQGPRAVPATFTGRR